MFSAEGLIMQTLLSRSPGRLTINSSFLLILLTLFLTATISSIAQPGDNRKLLDPQFFKPKEKELAEKIIKSAPDDESYSLITRKALNLVI